MFNSIKKLNKLKIKLEEDILYNLDKLDGGTYRLFYINGRWFWKEEKSFFAWAKELLKSSLGKKRKLYFLIFGRKIKNTTNGNKSAGNVMYATRKDNVKIFDYEKNIVSYYCQDKNVIKNAIDFNDNYAKYFGNKVILNCNLDDNLIQERLVKEAYEWREQPEKVNEMNEWLMDRVYKYESGLRTGSIEKVLCGNWINDIIKLVDSSETEGLIQRVKEKIDVREDIILVNQHNDLVLSNVLLETEFTVFDYEFFGKNIFYYDVFLWFTWKAIYYGDYKYIEKYFAGEWDEKLEKIFNCMNLQYEKKCRKKYIYIFILANIFVHLKFKDATDEKKYNNFLDYVENYEMDTL